MRIVLDTNVLVSGLLSAGGPPGQLLAALRRDAFTLVSSHEQIDELRRVLGYEKLRQRIPSFEAEILIETLTTVAQTITEPLPELSLSPDPDDNVILATAIAGGADIIATGDKTDLLALTEAQGIPIVTPREALARISEQ